MLVKDNKDMVHKAQPGRTGIRVSVREINYVFALATLPGWDSATRAIMIVVAVVATVAVGVFVIVLSAGCHTHYEWRLS